MREEDVWRAGLLPQSSLLSRRVSCCVKESVAPRYCSKPKHIRRHFLFTMFPGIQSTIVFVLRLIATGDSTETSPSWASASSSAMETPNEVDHSGLAFDFSRKCELNPTTELRRQQQRAALSKGHQQKAVGATNLHLFFHPYITFHFFNLSLPIWHRQASYSMPTTPEMTSETSPSPRQTTSGIFRFPFAGHGSPRRFRSRTLSGIVVQRPFFSFHFVKDPFSSSGREQCGGR